MRSSHQISEESTFNRIFGHTKVTSVLGSRFGCEFGGGEPFVKAGFLPIEVGEEVGVDPDIEGFLVEEPSLFGPSCTRVRSIVGLEEVIEGGVGPIGGLIVFEITMGSKEALGFAIGPHPGPSTRFGMKG